MNFFDQRVAALGGTRAGDPADQSCPVGAYGLLGNQGCTTRLL